ncbi:unnamed protein product, partial [Rotaria sp. Silwood2]
MNFIEKLSELERERQEQQSIFQTSHRQSSQDEEKSSTPTTPIEKDKPD